MVLFVPCRTRKNRTPCKSSWSPEACFSQQPPTREVAEASMMYHHPEIVQFLTLKKHSVKLWQLSSIICRNFDGNLRKHLSQDLEPGSILQFRTIMMERVIQALGVESLLHLVMWLDCCIPYQGSKCTTIVPVSLQNICSIEHVYY